MDSVQARGARLACGLPATTNTYGSLLEANLPPVSEKAKLLAYKSFLVSSLHGVSRAADVASNTAHGCSTRYTLWHKDALSIARERIAGDASKKLEARETHRRRVVGIKPTKTKHLTGVRLLDCLASQARTNWSPYWGDLHRILNPSVPKERPAGSARNPRVHPPPPRPSNRPGNEDGPPMQSRALSAPWCLLRARPG